MVNLFDPETPRWAKAGAAGLVAVVLLIVGGILAVTLSGGGDNGATAPPSGSSHPKPTSTSSPAATSTSSCGLPDGDQSIPTAAPAATWTEVGHLLVPDSTNYGPGKVDGVSRTCFAHNPLGAVLAAINLSNDVTVANPQGVQIAAIRVDDYTGSRATVEYVGRVTQGPNAGALAAVVGPVEWKDGDWHLVRAKGNFESNQISSLAGYIPFGPGGAS